MLLSVIMKHFVAAESLQKRIWINNLSAALQHVSSEYMCVFVYRSPGCPCRRKENLGCSVPVQEEGCCCGPWTQTRAGWSWLMPMLWYDSRFPTAAALASRWASGRNQNPWTDDKMRLRLLLLGFKWWPRDHSGSPTVYFTCIGIKSVLMAYECKCRILSKW